MYDVPMRTPEQAAKTAERHNKKLAKRFPLLADQLDVIGAWTPEKVLEDERRWRAKMDASDRRAQERGDMLRSLVAQRLTDEALADLDTYFRRVLPQNGGYWADFWWQKLKLYWPKMAQQECPWRDRHEVLAKYEPVCGTCGRRLIGIEIDPTYYAIAQRRIAEAQLQPPLLPNHGFHLTAAQVGLWDNVDESGAAAGEP